MFIVIVYVPVRDVINFESTLALLSSCFPIKPKKTGQRCKCLKYEESF